MLGARLLSITWEDTADYWEWNSLPESRFSEVAELRFVWWLEIKGNIDTKILSPRTAYAAYLVYQCPEESQWGFEGMPITVRVTNEQNEVVAEHDVFLADPPEDMPPQARSRGDGWMEIELGEIFNQEDDATVEFRLRETVSGEPKGGLIVEGIELRPKLYIYST
ncbi:putative F-box protein PP2-B12 [Rosa chinensis]|nr:putative F-box protein PP2-B12 [Rosa chinensis]